jgi:glutaredoxin
MKIVVYSKDNCPACVALKNRLNKEGESFTEIMVGKDMAREDFLAKFPQVRQMPHVEFVDTNVEFVNEV